MLTVVEHKAVQDKQHSYGPIPVIGVILGCLFLIGGVDVDFNAV